MKVIYQRYTDYEGILLSEDGEFLGIHTEVGGCGDLPSGNYVLSKGNLVTKEGEDTGVNLFVLDRICAGGMNILQEGTEILIRGKDYLINPF